MLEQLQQYLRSLHAGIFEPDTYLRPWITPAIADLLLAHGVVLRPCRVVHGMGRAFDCHRNALELATVNASVSAWFGFSLSRGVWWLHSWAMDEAGAVVDSGPPTTPTIYFGAPWGHELYTLIIKRQDIPTPPGLPPVLARSMFDVLR